MNEKPKTTNRGCLTFLLALCIVFTLALILAWFAIRHAIDRYTDDAPTQMPGVSLSEHHLLELRQRVRNFQQAIRQQRTTEPLVLSADEVNALLETMPAAKSVRGKVRFLIQNNQPAGQISVKLGDLGVPVFRDRYLNGVATFSLQVKDGVLHLYPKRVRVKGRSLPSFLQAAIRKQNLANDLNEDPRASMALEKLEAIEFQNNKLVIVVRQGY